MDFFNLSNSFCKFIYESAFYEDEKIQGKITFKGSVSYRDLNFRDFN